MILLGYLLDGRREHAARAAPRRPKIHQHRPIRLHNFSFPIRITNLSDKLTHFFLLKVITVFFLTKSIITPLQLRSFNLSIISDAVVHWHTDRNEGMRG